MNEKQKKEYVAPHVEITFVIMEEGIAAGSARVLPTNINEEVLEEWEVSPEDKRPIVW